MTCASQVQPSPEPPPAPEASVARVRVQKNPGAPPAPPGLREKACSVCGQTFQVTPDQKFFMCPACYQKDLLKKKATRRKGTQVLIQIQCPDCGASDYVDFLPQDPSTTYCRACYERRRREPKTLPDHT